jgi:hypothetical protein
MDVVCAQQRRARGGRGELQMKLEGGSGKCRGSPHKHTPFAKDVFFSREQLVACVFSSPAAAARMRCSVAAFSSHSATIDPRQITALITLLGDREGVVFEG